MSIEGAAGDDRGGIVAYRDLTPTIESGHESGAALTNVPATLA
jgi:hypothetical protein